jgi:hypothetical protein
VIHFDFQSIARFFVNRAVHRIDEALPSYLIKAKGLLSDLQSKEEQLRGRNLTDIIGHLERLINLYIFLKETISSIAEGASIFPEIKNWAPILTETIEMLYATLRLAKRYNLKTSHPASDLAVESSKRSLSSLERTSYVRRAT